MKKKRFYLILTLVFLLLLSACSGKDEKVSSDGKGKKFSGTLTVWVHPYVASDLKDQQTAVFDDMAKQFKKEYPNTKVKFEEIPWANRETKILTALAAKEGPDVFYLIPDMMAQFASKNVLTPITKLLGDDFDKDDFPKSSLDAVTYKGEMYGLPILHEVQSMVYNTKILEEVGGDKNAPPTTWEEFDQLAEKAVAKGYFARNFEGANTLNSTLYPLIWQAGGDIIKDNKVVINNKKGVKVFEKINDWYKKGWIPKDSTTALDHFTGFLEGKALSSTASGLTLSTLKDRGFDNYVLGPPLKGEKQVTFGTTGMFVVSANSKNKEAAAQLVKAMTDTEGSKAFNKLTKYVPARQSASDIYNDDPEMKQMTEWLKYTKPGVIHPVAREIMPKIQAELQAMLEGSKSPKEAADASAEAIKGEIDKQ
ncbi:sugar ABC transporter substrate-binding protein [Bacillus testis]|uniref:sugar ABC transporter substrate-binding protein n=1 Tax=Bacillus testis TaxID=1622072 RepID=UPI00067E835D|nr:sugar ABC transporter substrate-binding protein [Bacillus testis]